MIFTEMSGFTQQAFEKKLNDLNSSQQSIQTLSLWLIHHRKHYKAIVQTWFKELKKAKTSRRLTFMYLANDVIQNSRKKGPEFSKEFLNVLGKCFEHIAREIDAPTMNSLDRLLKIWDERNIYEKNHIATFRQALHDENKTSQPNSDAKETNAAAMNETLNSKTRNSTKREHDDSKGNGHIGSKKFASDHLNTDALNNIMSKVGSLVTNSSVDMDKFENVEPEKLIKTLQDLEKCASADEETRQKIACLPSELFDVKSFEKVVNKEPGQHWAKLVDDAQTILTAYNTRLAEELEERKQLSNMLVYFIESQRRALSQAEQNLNEYRDKLRKVVSVREELNSHLQNLPDLSQLPSVQPLPSPLDLFKK